MKICILTSAHPPLDNRIFYKQALSLKKKYPNITLIAPAEEEEYEQDGIRIIGVKRAGSLLERFQLTDVVIAKAIAEKADIYHFHDFELIYKAGKIKKALPQSKVIYDVHEHYPDMMSMSHKIPKAFKPLATFLVDKSEALLARKFDYIVTADDAVKERFLKFNTNTDVIYNFSEFEMQEEYNPPKEYDLIYQGGITLARGAYKLAETVNLLKRKYPGIKLIFVGPFDEPQEREMVHTYIQNNGLTDNIIFTGRVPHTEVEDYIRKSRIGAVTLLPVPKYYKNIPIKQFEYMSCGIPVVGSDLPPIRRFLTAYNSGIIVDPTKPEEIAAAVERLLDNPALCQELGKNGMKAVREEYNWGKMEDRLLEIYQELESGEIGS